MSESEQVNFEETLAELERLVDEMESGDLSLEKSLEAFERGVKLSRACQKALHDAKLRVEKVLPDGELEPFETGTNDDG